MEMICTPEKEIQSRIDRFQHALKRKRLDGAIISQNVDLFYFSGTTQRALLYVPSEGPPVLVVQKSRERARKESPVNCIEPMETLSDMKRALEKYGFGAPKTVGIEFDVLPVTQFLRLQKAFPDTHLSDVSFLIRQLRMVKTPFEVEQIRKAVGLAEDVLGRAREIIRDGMAELEVDGLLGGFARSRGDQGRLRMRGWNQEMFPCHVFCGKTAAVQSFTETPIGGPGTTPATAQGAGHNRIRQDEPILVDVGAGINGYVADLTRTFVIGELSEKKLYKGYELIREIEAFVESEIRPGRICSAIYREVVSLVEAKGFGEFFMGSGQGKVAFIGHGLGLEIDELPVLAKRYHSALEQGMVIAVEPKLVFPEEGAIGLENDYLVTRSGVEKLSHFDEEIVHL